MFITVSEFNNIDVENIGDYSMSLAPRSSYEGRVIDDTVSGFAYSKVDFISVDNQNIFPSSDEELIVALDGMIKKWRYAYDCIDFTFYYSGSLTEKDLEEMYYADIIQSNSLKMTVRVKHKNINMEALRDLSNKPEIERISISAPISPIEDTEPREDIPLEVAYEKFYFSFTGNIDRKAQSHKDVISLINQTFGMGCYDHLVFIFYYNGSLSEEDFVEMNYTMIQVNKYPWRMYMQVKFEDINIDALKKLSDMSEISRISVSHPSFFEVQND